MTRIFTDGAEMKDILFFDITPGLFIDTGPISPSAYRLEGANTAGKVLPSTYTELYFRQRFKINRGAYSKFKMYSDGTEVLAIGDDGLHMVANIDGLTVDTSSLLIYINIWYLMEIYYKMADSGGRIVVKIDGLTYIDYTGDTKPGAVTYINRLYWVTGTNSIYYIDDLALNDTAGGVDDSWCGDGIVVKLTPDEDGAHNNWHGSDTDDVDNYLLVDDYPHDTDTTYVYHDGAGAGTQQAFAMDDTYSGTNKTIVRVYAEARARKTSAVGYQIKLGQKSGAMGVVSAGRDVLEGQYIRIVGDDAIINIDTGLAWTEADIDALEFIAEVA